MKKLFVGALAAAAAALPAVPAEADTSARAGAASCYKLGSGHHGVFVWWYDLDGNYHRTDTCVFIRP